MDTEVYGLEISTDKGLTNLELSEYAKKVGIEIFRGVFMKDTLPRIPHHKECRIMNLNTSRQPGSHWDIHMEKSIRVDTTNEFVISIKLSAPLLLTIHCAYVCVRERETIIF